jgi:hypothetical protein
MLQDKELLRLPEIESRLLKHYRWRRWIMRQYAWLELNDGMWCLLANGREDVRKATRKWADEKKALA